MKELIKLLSVYPHAKYIFDSMKGINDPILLQDTVRMLNEQCPVPKHNWYMIRNGECYDIVLLSTLEHRPPNFYFDKIFNDYFKDSGIIVLWLDGNTTIESINGFISKIDEGTSCIMDWCTLAGNICVKTSSKDSADIIRRYIVDHLELVSAYDIKILEATRLLF